MQQHQKQQCNFHCHFFGKYVLIVKYERFLQLFDENKKKGTEALKFVKKFDVALTVSDTTTLAHTDDYFSVGEILSFFGSNIDSFEDKKEALARASYLCERNQKEHGYEKHAPCLDDKFPEYSRFFFRKSKGRTVAWEQDEQKQLSGEVGLKNLKQLEEAKVFLEGHGLGDQVETPGVQVANVKYEKLQESTAVLK